MNYHVYRDCVCKSSYLSYVFTSCYYDFAFLINLDVLEWEDISSIKASEDPTAMSRPCIQNEIVLTEEDCYVW